MIINTVTTAYFSPTGNVRKAALRIGEITSSILGATLSEFDFLTPDARSRFARQVESPAAGYSIYSGNIINDKKNGDNFEKGTVCFGANDLLIIGLPVYAGRIPNKILPFVQSAFKGDGTPCIPLVCYGNRSFGDALSELVMELRSNGFVVCGGAAIVSEHSFCGELANGRPDEDDMVDIEAYAKRISEMIRGADDANQLIEIDRNLDVPGSMPPGSYYIPLKEDGTPAVFLKAKPKTDPEKCDKCMECVKVCPFASISSDDPAAVPGICIKCQACIKVCPAGAKYFDDEAFLSHRAYLAANYTARKENTFL